MKLYEDLKFTGENESFPNDRETIWHCTSVGKDFESGDITYIVQAPIFNKGSYVEYNNTEIYIVAEDDLVRNFKIFKKSGELEDITYSIDKSKLIENISDYNEWLEKECS